MPPVDIQAVASSVKQQTIKGPLTAEQIDNFFEDGFLVLPSFYSAESVKAVEEDVSGMIDRLASRLHAAGKVKSTYSHLGWTQRLKELTREFPDAPVVFIKGGVLPKALQNMFGQDDILDAAAQLGIGPDVSLNAAWNLRSKMPSHEETVVPWHQDNSYWEPRIWDEQVLTVWVALVDAHKENGCMQFVRGAHKKGLTATHTIGTTTRTWYTECSERAMAEELLGTGGESENDVHALVRHFQERIVTCEVPVGTAIIFPGTTPHRSLNSKSDEIRWSCDFRLHRAHAKRPGAGPNDWFYGLKDSLVLRGPDGQGNPDWTDWAGQERTQAQDDGMKTGNADPFDPIIVGPWMDLWNLDTHVKGLSNKHVDRYLGLPDETRDIEAKYISKGHW